MPDKADLRERELLQEQKKLILEERKTIADAIKRLIVFAVTFALAAMFKGMYEEVSRAINLSDITNWDQDKIIRCVCISTVFITTILPFFHGSIRALDYVFGGTWRSKKSPAGFLLSFLVTLLNIAPFFVMAAIIERSSGASFEVRERLFYIAHFSLLLVNCWVLFLFLIVQKYFNCRDISCYPAQFTWMMLNSFFCVLVVIVVKYFGVKSMACPSTQLFLVICYTTLCAVRNHLDYWFAWNFYMPNPLLITDEGTKATSRLALEEYKSAASQPDVTAAREYMHAPIPLQALMRGSESSCWLIAMLLVVVSIIIAGSLAANFGELAACIAQ